MLSTDLKLKNRILGYLEYIVLKGINIQPNQVVEILTSSYIKDTVVALSDILYRYGAKDVVITYIDGYEIEEEINEDWQGFLNKRIDMYKSLVYKQFVRITLLSPFNIPLARTDSVDSYRANSHKLSFVYDYLNSNVSQRTVAAIPNENWAMKLQISINSLWERIISFIEQPLILEDYKDTLSRMNIEWLYFNSDNGTNLEVGLINGFSFLGRRWKTISNIEYEPNIPCMEIFTSPHKYKINGVLYNSKPLFYKGHVYNNIMIEFKNGAVVNSSGIDYILGLDEGLSYVGEIAIVIPRDDDDIYYNTLLDENLGCHIALGNSFANGINDTSYINTSNYHVDIVVGTADINCYGISSSGERIDILINGEFKLVKE